MATIRELERGVWLDESVPEGFRRDVESLCHLLSNCVADAVVSLAMFEDAHAASDPSRTPVDHDEWNREAERQRQREAELEAAQGIAWGQPDYFERHSAITEQVRRELQRERWAQQGGPEMYRHRVVFIHARSFVTSMAVLQRALIALSEYDFAPDVASKVQVACDAFAAALPGLKGVRDSAAHPEDRVRGKARRRTIATQPVVNSMIHAPGGGVMIVEALNNYHFGGTIADGTHAEIEVADATTEVARAAVQAVYDALPWRPGNRMYEPSS